MQFFWIALVQTCVYVMRAARVWHLCTYKRVRKQMKHWIISMFHWRSILLVTRSPCRGSRPLIVIIGQFQIISIFIYLLYLLTRWAVNVNPILHSLLVWYNSTEKTRSSGGSGLTDKCVGGIRYFPISIYLTVECGVSAVKADETLPPWQQVFNSDNWSVST